MMARHRMNPFTANAFVAVRQSLAEGVLLRAEEAQVENDTPIPRRDLLRQYPQLQ